VLHQQDKGAQQVDIVRSRWPLRSPVSKTGGCNPVQWRILPRKLPWRIGRLPWADL